MRCPLLLLLRLLLRRLRCQPRRPRRLLLTVEAEAALSARLPKPWRVAAERVTGFPGVPTMFALLGERPEIKDRPGAKPLSVPDGEIRFDHVTFGI